MFASPSWKIILMPQDILALEIIKMKRKLISLVVLSLLAFATLSVFPAVAADIIGPPFEKHRHKSTVGKPG